MQYRAKGGTGLTTAIPFGDPLVTDPWGTDRHPWDILCCEAFWGTGIPGGRSLRCTEDLSCPGGGRTGPLVEYCCTKDSSTVRNAGPHCCACVVCIDYMLSRSFDAIKSHYFRRRRMSGGGVFIRNGPLCRAHTQTEQHAHGYCCTTGTTRSLELVRGHRVQEVRSAVHTHISKEPVAQENTTVPGRTRTRAPTAAAAVVLQLLCSIGVCVIS